jgi:hypothetical protein
VRKSNGYYNSRDACTSIKGISNMWLTGAYGKVIREAYTAVMCTLLPHHEAIIRVLVFESDLHIIIDARNRAMAADEAVAKINTRYHNVAESLP